MRAPIRMPTLRSRFSLRTILLLFIPAALMAALAARVFRPPPVDVEIAWRRASLYHEEDEAGRPRLVACLSLTNWSRNTVWYLGGPGAPTKDVEELVGGEWNFVISGPFPDGASDSNSPSRLAWAPLRSMESVTMFVGLSEEATEAKVGIPFTTEWFPSKAHWVYSPPARIVKTRERYFLEVDHDAPQEVRVLPLTAP